MTSPDRIAFSKQPRVSFVHISAQMRSLNKVISSKLCHSHTPHTFIAFSGKQTRFISTFCYFYLVTNGFIRSNHNNVLKSFKGMIQYFFKVHWYTLNFQYYLKPWDYGLNPWFKLKVRILEIFYLKHRDPEFQSLILVYDSKCQGSEFKSLIFWP